MFSQSRIWQGTFILLVLSAVVLMSFKMYLMIISFELRKPSSLALPLLLTLKLEDFLLNHSQFTLLSYKIRRPTGFNTIFSHQLMSSLFHRRLVNKPPPH
jgi:hypothetical protein